MELNGKNLKKIMLLIIFTAFVFVAMQRFETVLQGLGILWNIIFPFVLGAAIAFVLNVPMNFIEKNLNKIRVFNRYNFLKKMLRPLSLILTLLSFIVTIILVFFVVVPSLSQTVMLLGQQIEDFIPKVQTWAEDLFENNADIQEQISNIEIDWENISNSVFAFFKQGAGNILSSTMVIARTIFSLIINIFIGFIFSCYVLLQKEKLASQFQKVLKAIFVRKIIIRINYIGKLSYRIFSNFITGQCLEALILGAMFFVCLLILGFPYPLLISILIGFTALIPLVGSFIGCGLGIFLILMENPMRALLFLILFLVLQQIEGNFIYPHVVGNSVGLPSIWVLVAVTVGGNLMGVAGMLIFIPISSILYTLFREWVYLRIENRKSEERTQ